MSIRSRLLATILVGAFSALPMVAFAQASKPATTAPATSKPGDAKPAELLDINTASKAELMTLDGIGDARSDAIIKGRPYCAKNELADRKIAPEAVYEGIKDKIIAKHASASTAPATPAKK